ncbi:hypothetical protein LCGC14_0323740 [marine sediment metagenome]|uniref:Uncharacterized protein n=1 Tax=marine sediment metagenome TaxID=412755 RepID=A0A0F9WQK8_9ZZZZ
MEGRVPSRPAVSAESRLVVMPHDLQQTQFHIGLDRQPRTSSHLCNHIAIKAANCGPRLINSHFMTVKFYSTPKTTRMTLNEPIYLQHQQPAL